MAVHILPTPPRPPSQQPLSPSTISQLSGAWSPTDGTTRLPSPALPQHLHATRSSISASSRRVCPPHQAPAPPLWMRPWHGAHTPAHPRRAHPRPGRARAGMGPPRLSPQPHRSRCALSPPSESCCSLQGREAQTLVCLTRCVRRGARSQPSTPSWAGPRTMCCAAVWAGPYSRGLEPVNSTQSSSPPPAAPTRSTISPLSGQTLSPRASSPCHPSGAPTCSNTTCSVTTPPRYGARASPLTRQSR